PRWPDTENDPEDHHRQHSAAPQSPGNRRLTFKATAQTELIEVLTSRARWATRRHGSKRSPRFMNAALTEAADRLHFIGEHQKMTQTKKTCRERLTAIPA
ncbi:MAG: hypothetical protein AAGC57_12810, partial [Pseudomonadota bacterium]